MPADFVILGLGMLASAPPALPGSPALQQWLFERPIVGGLILLAFALASFLVLNRMGKGPKALLVAGLLLLCAVGVTAAGVLVETPRERLIRLSNDLVDSVAEGRVDDARAMLADDLVVALGPSTLPGGDFADRALDAFRSAVRVTEHVVTDESASAASPPTSGVSQFLVRASTDVGFATAWVRLNWRQNPSGAWEVYLLEVLRVNGREPDGSAGFGLFGR
ncbi:MAG: hypothetical protein ACTS27_11885 [Phycisphaerales bacterium]